MCVGVAAHVVGGAEATWEGGAAHSIRGRSATSTSTAADRTATLPLPAAWWCGPGCLPLHPRRRGATTYLQRAACIQGKGAPMRHDLVHAPAEAAEMHRPAPVVTAALAATARARAPTNPSSGKAARGSRRAAQLDTLPPFAQAVDVRQQPRRPPGLVLGRSNRRFCRRRGRVHACWGGTPPRQRQHACIRVDANEGGRSHSVEGRLITRS